MASELYTCELCGRQVSFVTRHHLIPKSQHKRNRIQKRFSKEEMLGNVAQLCKPCHKYIHSALSEKQLAEEYSDIRALKNQQNIKKFIEWIEKKPDGFYSVTRKMKR